MTTITTKWLTHAFLNNHKLYGKSISIDLNSEPTLKPLVEKNNIAVRHVVVNDIERNYVNFRFVSDFKCFDEDNKEINFRDGLFTDSQVKFVILVKPYDFQGKKGISAKICQCKFKPKEKIYDVCLFD